MKNQLPFAEVEWNDAWVDGVDPVTPAEAHVEHKPKVIVTCGYILRDDEAGISLVNEHYKDESVYRGRTFIPRVMIREVRLSKIVRVKAPKKIPTTLHTASALPSELP